MKYLRLSVLGLISSVAFGYPTVYPTGTTIYDPDNAYSGYILVADHNDRSNHPSAAARTEGQVPGDIRLLGELVYEADSTVDFRMLQKILQLRHESHAE